MNTHKIIRDAVPLCAVLRFALAIGAGPRRWLPLAASLYQTSTKLPVLRAEMIDCSPLLSVERKSQMTACAGLAAEEETRLSMHLNLTVSILNYD